MNTKYILVVALVVGTCNATDLEYKVDHALKAALLKQQTGQSAGAWEGDAEDQYDDGLDLQVQSDVENEDPSELHNRRIRSAKTFESLEERIKNALENRPFCSSIIDDGTLDRIVFGSTNIGSTEKYRYAGLLKYLFERGLSSDLYAPEDESLIVRDPYTTSLFLRYSRPSFKELTLLLGFFVDIPSQNIGAAQCKSLLVLYQAGFNGEEMSPVTIKKFLQGNGGGWPVFCWYLAGMGAMRGVPSYESMIPSSQFNTPHKRDDFIAHMRMAAEQYDEMPQAVRECIWEAVPCLNVKSADKTTSCADIIASYDDGAANFVRKMAVKLQEELAAEDRIIEALEQEAERAAKDREAELARAAKTHERACKAAQKAQRQAAQARVGAWR